MCPPGPNRVKEGKHMSFSVKLESDEVADLFLAFTSPKHYSSVQNMSWASLPTPPGSTGTPPPSSASANVLTTWIGTTGR